MQARQVFKLLADNAPNIRHAAATLAADMLEDEGQLFLGTQVTAELLCRMGPGCMIRLEHSLCPPGWFVLWAGFAAALVCLLMVCPYTGRLWTGVRVAERTISEGMAFLIRWGMLLRECMATPVWANPWAVLLEVDRSATEPQPG